eukprot:g65817.t1
MEDIRNGFSLAVLIRNMLLPNAEHRNYTLHPSLIGDIDSTWIEIGTKGVARICYNKEFVDERQKEILYGKPTEEGRRFFVHFFTIQFADGDSAGAAIVISDRQIPEGKVVFMSIKGLGTNSDQTGFVICISAWERLGLHQTILEKIILPEFEKRRKSLQGNRFDSKDPRSNLDERCFLMGDGEIEQTKVWSDKKNVAKFKAAYTHAMKLPAGLSLLYQSNDKNQPHKLLKQSSQQDWYEDHVDARVMQTLQQRIKAAKQEHKSVKFSRDFWPRVKKAVLVIHSLLPHCWRKTVVKAGFLDSGLVGKNDIETNTLYPDVRKILSQIPAFKRLTQDEADRIVNAALDYPLSEICKLTEQQMDELQIPTTELSQKREKQPNMVNRDEMTVWNQRAMIYTSEAFEKDQEDSKKRIEEAKAKAEKEKKEKEERKQKKQEEKDLKEFKEKHERAHQSAQARKDSGTVNWDDYQCFVCGVWWDDCEKEGCSTFKKIT